MRNKEKKQGGIRLGAGRPLQSKEKGKKHTHSTTFYDIDWQSITEEAEKLSLSASQYLAMIHNKYIKSKK